jgi:hypothetical protein
MNWPTLSLTALLDWLDEAPATGLGRRLAESANELPPRRPTSASAAWPGRCSTRIARARSIRSPKIAQQLHIGHRKARRFMQSWQRRQTSRLA